MSLVEKLRRIAAPAAAPVVAAPSTGLPGEIVEGPEGIYWRRRVRFPLTHGHGNLRLDEIRASAVAPLSEVARDPRLAEIPLERAIFFDTETTSLGGGVGTYVFLLGAGWFEEDSFLVEQYFLREVTEERALLSAVNRRLSSFPIAVSFHGKGFDAPRLTDRLAFHRMQLALPELHLDLCLVGRALYRGAFSDCRLQTFESRLVRFRREDDFPGAECPGAFFDHLRGNSSKIPKVFEHNLYDVLTLPAVAACFAREAAAPKDPVVLANLGLFYESEGRDRAARASFLAALEGLRTSRHPLLARALERLALLERRAGRHAESAALLLERKETLPYALQPLEDLAKFYEHRARDFERAAATALEAKSRILTGKIVLDAAGRIRSLRALDHRLRRLRRRQERAPVPPPA